MDPVRLDIYKNSYICGELFTINYGDVVMLPGQNRQCPQGKKQCGRNSEVIFCFPADNKCPVNDVVVSDVRLSNMQDYTEEKGNGFYLYYSKTKIDKDIPVEFDIAYDQMCLRGYERLSPKKQMAYMRGTYTQNCSPEPYSNKKFDSSYHAIDRINYLEQLTQNGVINKLSNQISTIDTNSLNYDKKLF